MPRLLLLLACCLLPLHQAWAWGHTGHREISLLAMRNLPEDLPEALRSPAAIALVGALGPELDLSKGSGVPHDAELDPGHYMNLDAEGLVAGLVPLDRLPASREAYDSLLRAGGSSQYRAGYLLYALHSGWQQTTKDFAWLRAALAGERLGETEADRAWFTALAAHRTQRALHNLGTWSHYVADASQPLHVSTHHNGWGPHPNPRGFTQDRGLHARFEGAFIRSQINWQAVAAALPAPRDCACTPRQRLVEYLRTTLAQVEPLYELEQTGAFRGQGTPQGVAFATARLAAGAAELRDLITLAWRASANEKVGWPAQSVAEMEAGRLRMHRAMFWAD